MRISLGVLSLLALLALAAPSSAGQIWLDGNGDGLPDQNPFNLLPSDQFTIDVWIDTQSFAFTAFRVTVDHRSSTDLVSATYAISGGTNAPIDSTSRPFSVIYSGSGYATHGVQRIGSLTTHVATLISCDCGDGYMEAVVDPGDPFGSRLLSGGGQNVMEFTTQNGTCLGWTSDFPSGACCLPGGGCFSGQESDCWNAGGTWYGPCSGLGRTECPTTATENETWAA